MMTKQLAVFVLVVSAVFSTAMAVAIDRDQISNLCKAHPAEVDALFSKLDLERTGLAKVKAAWQEGEKAEACVRLLEYYNDGSSGQWLRETPPRASFCGLDADEVLQDTFTFQEVKATVPRDADGMLDWNYMPSDDFQWTLFLNRHCHLQDLLHAYAQTKKPAYARKINADLRDWILASPYPGKATPYSDERDVYQWRLLETGSRAEVWPNVFYGLGDQLDGDVALLMLYSLPDHGHCLRHYHARGGNHLVLELKGLSAVAAAFPEIKSSEEWLDYAGKIMSEQIIEQVYPDGAQKELTVHYHGVALRSFQKIAFVLQQAGKAVPQLMDTRLRAMLDYLAYVQRPDGNGPLNNDSDLCDIRSSLANVRDSYQQDDWDYIISNGKDGTRPERLSVFYPWAGQLVMRNGWDHQAHWGFFDVGPMGSGHRHYDKLHLSVSAYGRDLLVDSGRYTYVGYAGGTNPWRDYFIGTSGHNTIIVDGKGQNRFPYVNKEPVAESHLLGDDFAFARGDFEWGYGDNKDVRHLRAVTYRQDKYWIVVDRVVTDKPVRIATLWHFHPDCTVKQQDGAVLSCDKGQGNLRVQPVAGVDWQVGMVKGQEQPEIQGWYSEMYNEKVPCSTAIYETDIAQTATFAWVLSVAPDAAPQAVPATIEQCDGPVVTLLLDGSCTLDVPLTGPLSAFDLRQTLKK